MQLEYLRSVVDCTDVTVWGISQEEVDLFAADMEPKGYSIETTLDAGEIGSNCNLIVTATPSKKPLLLMEHIREGTHITAMGSDTPVKQELDPGVVAGADIVVVDSIEQCCLRGECFKAMEAGAFNREKMVELGRVIADPSLRRSSDKQITVADLTGVAIQDIQISKAVYEALK
jgi:ornithine cyclodeaminase